jgi:polygalacturonase
LAFLVVTGETSGWVTDVIVRDSVLAGTNLGEPSIRFSHFNHKSAIAPLIFRFSVGAVPAQQTTAHVPMNGDWAVRVDCQHTAVRLKTSRGRGGGIERVVYEDLSGHTNGGIQLNTHYGTAPPTNVSATPVIRNITVRNVRPIPTPDNNLCKFCMAIVVGC